MPTRYKGERYLEVKAFVELPFESGKEIPKVVILIPGIRTNAEWISQLTHYVETKFDTIKIYGSYGGRISSIQLITRIGLRSIKEEVRRQIIRTKVDNPGVEISLICHSMGSDILAGILDDLPFSFEYIFFVGAICHTKHSQKIKGSCKTLINHRGDRDAWPIIASMVRPCRYSASGTFGFRKSYVEDVIFDNNHETCTSLTHIADFILPVVFGQNSHYPNVIRPRFDFNVYHYMRRMLYISAVIGILFSHFTLYSLLLPVASSMFILWFYCRN